MNYVMYCTAKNKLYTGGYKIYTTQKSNIQETLENEISSVDLKKW